MKLTRSFITLVKIQMILPSIVKTAAKTKGSQRVVLRFQGAIQTTIVTFRGQLY